LFSFLLADSEHEKIVITIMIISQLEEFTTGYDPFHVALLSIKGIYLNRRP
jgi:hypothetical protein